MQVPLTNEESRSNYVCTHDDSNESPRGEKEPKTDKERFELHKSNTNKKICKLENDINGIYEKLFDA
jgi:hypothetical protein